MKVPQCRLESLLVTRKQDTCSEIALWPVPSLFVPDYSCCFDMGSYVKKLALRSDAHVLWIAHAS